MTEQPIKTKQTVPAAERGGAGRTSLTPPAAPAGPDIPPSHTLCLTRQEFAESFRLSVRTVDRRIKAGVIKAQHVGVRAVRIPRTEAERFLGRSLQTATNPCGQPSGLSLSNLKNHE